MDHLRKRNSLKPLTPLAKEGNDGMNTTGTSFANESFSTEPSSARNSARKVVNTHYGKEYYTEEYAKVLGLLKEYNTTSASKPLTADQLKELSNRTGVLLQDWIKQEEDTKKQASKLPLIRGLVLLLENSNKQGNAKVKLRLIRGAFFALKQCEFKTILESFEARPSSRGDIDGETVRSTLMKGSLVDCLHYLLKVTLDVSKESVNSKLFIEEGVLAFLMELIDQMKLLGNALPMESFVILCTIIKNITGNEDVRKKLLDPKQIEKFSAILATLISKTSVKRGFDAKALQGIYQLTACLRNLAIDSSCTVVYLEANIIESLCKIVTIHIQDAELILNCIRILSKLSLSRECCLKINEDKACLQSFLKILKLHRVGLYLVIRVAFIMANLSSFIEEIRDFIYFKIDGMKEILEAFNHYIGRELNPNSIDMDAKMRSSFTNFDVANSKKETDMDALIKLIRLLANLFTLEPVGVDFIAKHTATFKEILLKINELINKKNVKTHSELIQCSLSCISNMLFFEKHISAEEDFDMQKLKTELVFTMTRYIIQNDNEDICCEALRVVSNISRDKTVHKHVWKSNIFDAAVELLKSSNKELVYYCVGICMNMMLSPEVKQPSIMQKIISGLVQILYDSTIDDIDIVSACLKCLTNVLDNFPGIEDIDREIIKDIEELALNYGEQCDVVIGGSNKSQDNPESSAGEIASLRSVVNQLLNNIPEESYRCQIISCGRKFKSKKDMQTHMERRHQSK